PGIVMCVDGIPPPISELGFLKYLVCLKIWGGFWPFWRGGVDLVGHRTGLTVGDLLCICGQCPGWSASISWPRQKYYYRYRAGWFIDRDVYWIFRYYVGRAAHDRSSVVLPSFGERSRVNRANWHHAISLAIHTNTRLPHPLVPSPVCELGGGRGFADARACRGFAVDRARLAVVG